MGHNARNESLVDGKPASRRTLASIGWFLWFALLWWIIAEGNLESWPVGLPLVLFAALWSAQRGTDEAAPRPTRFLQFAPFFTWFSVKGGFAVAKASLQRELALDPAVISMPLRLPAGAARTAFVSICGMLPGTLGVELEDSHLQVHVLDKRGSFQEELMMLEEQIAALYGQPLRRPVGKTPTA